MVSRQETARPLLTPGEVMQLPANDELVLISGLPPIRAKKLRYFEDRNFTRRVLPAPNLAIECKRSAKVDDWTGHVRSTDPRLALALAQELGDPTADDDGGLQRHPGLPDAGIARPTQDASDDLAQILDDDLRTTGIGKPMRTHAIQRAHAMNNDAGHRHDDLMPSF